MRSRRVVLILFAALAMTPAAAHEDGVYESLGHIPIGRIFLTPEQRASLDNMRGKTPQVATSRPTTGTRKQRAASNDAAGFIVSDTGITRVWKDGDFVTSASASNVRFPGTVRVTSQTVPKGGEEATEPEADFEQSVGAGDDEE